jgi:hypothetical protein
MLECFWQLVSSDPGVRRAAEVALLEEMSLAQEKEEDGTLSHDVEYAIMRLVRGLSSSTEAARQVGVPGPTSRLPSPASTPEPPP